MKNIIFLIAMVSLCSHFSLDAQSRQHPVTKSNGNPDCISVRVTADRSQLSISEGSRRIIVSWHDVGGEAAQDMLGKLHVAAFYYYNNSRVIIGSRPLTDASWIFDEDEIPDFTATCMMSYGSNLYTGEMNLTFDDSLLPAPAGICDEETEFAIYMDVMYWNGNQLIALNQALLNPEEVGALHQLFPAPCFWSPMSWDPVEFSACIQCERQPKGLRSRLGNTPADPIVKTIEVVPNPFVDDLLIRVVSEKVENTSIELFDIQGRQILQQSVRLAKGFNQIPISASILAEGIYFIQLKSSEDLRTIKVIKRKP